MKAGKAFSTRLPLLKTFVRESKPEFKASLDFSCVLTLKLHLVPKSASTLLFNFLVKSEFKSFLSILFGNELSAKLKGTFENLFKPLLSTILPFDLPFEFNADFNIKLSNKSKTESGKGLTTLVLEWTAPQAKPSSG
ncbi:MAG: hypothetical protein ABIK39_06720 [candidate division WOR-3 bacterium]